MCYIILSYDIRPKHQLYYTACSGAANDRTRSVKLSAKGTAQMDIHIGDELVMKKPHPCGGNRFAVLRVGMDFRIRCINCGREVMVPRGKAEVFRNSERVTDEELSKAAKKAAADL